MITVIDHRLPSEYFDSVVEIVKQESSNLSITDNIKQDVQSE
jgi:hypothetical protein